MIYVHKLNSIHSGRLLPVFLNINGGFMSDDQRVRVPGGTSFFTLMRRLRRRFFHVIRNRTFLGTLTENAS